jgi:hypothetical protein
MHESTTAAVTTPPGPAPDPVTRWLSASPGQAAAVGGLAFLLWQPVAHGLLHLAFGDPIAFRSAAAWARFEASVAALGALTGWAFHRSRAWPTGTWRRDWAEWALPMIAAGAIFGARGLPSASVVGWMVAVVAGAACTGATFAGVAQLVRVKPIRPPEA